VTLRAPPSSRTRTPPLRTVRKAQGLTLRQVSRLAELDPAHLSRVERGHESLSIDALYRVAKVLKLDELARLLEQYRPGKAS
jgi:transcriptional regulator with XRE-family HTH domain